MAMTAKLFLGPRDGESINIVEPISVIEVMVNTSNPDRDYDTVLYRREDRQEAPGVFRYHYEGIKREKEEA